MRKIERTVLAGRVKHEINAVEVDNEESRRLLELRTLESLRPKLSTKFVNKDLSTLDQGLILPGTMGAMKTFGNFIVSFFLTSLLQHSNSRRKPKVLAQVAGLNSARQHAYLKTSFWTRYSPVSVDTTTGP